jgi:hypothetical protein
MEQSVRPRAFISCSLRVEDKPFVEFVEGVVRSHGFEPFGTVGRYTASPQPPVNTMRENLSSADCVVVAATPRYLQMDLSGRGETGQTVSDMLVAEAAMAFCGRKPVLVFAQANTDVGQFMRSITQYVGIDPFSQADINAKRTLIQDYFRNATAMVAANWGEERRKDTWDVIVAVLAVIGACAVIYALAKSR